jgi:hypothetical protein
MNNYKTPCCTADVIRKGRAHYVCAMCGADVSLEVFYYVSAVMREERMRSEKAVFSAESTEKQYLPEVKK